MRGMIRKVLGFGLLSLMLAVPVLEARQQASHAKGGKHHHKSGKKGGRKAHARRSS
jgi:hypothetical protein